jgi:biotin carboxylase
VEPPHLVVVSPRHSYRTGAHLDAADRLGCRVTVVTDAQVALAGSAIVVDLSDPYRAAEEVDQRLERAPDAVVGTDGDALLAAATMAARFGLASSPPAAVEVATDKRAQRQALDRAGVRQPRWAVARADGGWPDIGPGPLVVKPTDRQGGQGVIRAGTEREARAAVARVRHIVEPGATVLVEGYVPGTEVAVDALVVDGEPRPLALFDKPDTGVGPFFAETLLVRPARLDEDARRDLLELTADAVEAIGLTAGAVHLEARIDHDGRPWFIELAPRSIGGRCADLIRPRGRRLEEAVIEAALGRPLPSQLEARGPASGVSMIPVPAAGALSGVTGVEAAEAVAGVTGVDICMAPGTEVTPLPDVASYVAFVFATGAGPDEVESALRRATEVLEVTVSRSGSTGRSRPGGR